MNSLRRFMIKLNDKLQNMVIHRPLKKERDLQKRFEAQLWMEIRGAFLCGMDSAMSWVKYKTYYYNKLPSEGERQKVRNTLLIMLKSSKYDISNKAIISYVCADIGIKESAESIESLFALAENPRDKRLFEKALSALQQGIEISNL